MGIRKYGAEPAQTEVRAEDNDPETLRLQAALAAAPETAAAIDEFLAHPETGVRWERRERPHRKTD